MEILKKWQQKLLDLGKRNRLINYMDFKLGTCAVNFPDINTVYKKMTGTSPVYEVFDIDSFISQNKPKDDENYDIDSLIQQAKKKIKYNQTLIFKQDISTKQLLKHINKKSKEYIIEKGINILYMAFGFIKWRESQSSNKWYKAPVLLVPISIKNQSALNPYYIKQYEDEVVINPAFSYKLMTEYNIDLPQIEDNQSIGEYLKILEKYIYPLGWQVCQEIRIAMFSFLKINMYLDVKNNQEKMLSNPNIKVLLGKGNISKGEQEKSEEELKKSFNNFKLHNVVDADSSQVEAIKMAKSGKSFVLQGPPGTGKSQTITNIIAECLYDNKKVLFVSEKIAALEVVFNNLKKVDLNDFCLQLHSHKTNKKEVISELNRVLKKSRFNISAKAREELYELEDIRKQLDEYVKSLHQVQGVIGLSSYQLYNKVSGLSDVSGSDFVISKIDTRGKNYIVKAVDILNRYVEYTKTIGSDYTNNEWFGYVDYDTSYEHKIKLKNHLKQAISVSKELKTIKEKVLRETGLDVNSFHKALEFQKVFALLGEMNFFSKEIVCSTTMKKIIELFTNMKALSEEINYLSNNINEKYEETIYEIDAKKMYSRFVKSYGNVFRILNKRYKEDVNELRMSQKDVNLKHKYNELVEFLKKLIIIHENNKKLEENEPLIVDVLGEYYKKSHTDWNNIIIRLNKLYLYIENGLDISQLAKDNSLKYSSLNKTFMFYAERLGELIEKSQESLSFLEKSFDKSIFDMYSTSIDIVIQKIEQCLFNFDYLENWIGFLKLLYESKTYEIDKYINHAINEKVPIEIYVKQYCLLFYNQWIYHIFSQNPILGEFDRISQDKRVDLFSQKDKLQFEISKAQITTKLSDLRPNIDMVSSGSPVAILLREGEKKRKQMPVRILLSHLRELVYKLKPCFLMSPLSVSSFLDSDYAKFDVVIFDEASQVFPEDALGAVYRSKQIIIVGDSKQMPPSNFFTATIASDDYNEDDYFEDVTDFESILDICSTSYAQKRLLWHYRSKVEDLISFSNKNFYDGNLITFPSNHLTSDQKSKIKYLGIDFHFESEGVFDRKTKINRVEAERVADLVFEHMEKFPERSLGVVAFSQSQQDAIDNIINKRREQSFNNEEFFRDDKSEPFFVKNLETVQGDERDTIIFSIGYAKDENGKFLHNFGPLNRQGGERRLNVAITRAKLNIQLVSSIRQQDIDLKRTNAQGTRLLKEYLDYAENGPISLRQEIKTNSIYDTDSELEFEVYNFLRDQGVNVDRQVGSSGYRIDLAVRHPKKAEYILAIECDGVTYHSIKATRDRDRLRQEVLHSMGWKFYRIWSTEWFKNKKIEQQRLINAIAKEMNIDKSKDIVKDDLTPESEFNNEFIEVIKDKPAFKKYELTSLYSIIEKNTYSEVLEEIALKEAPVSEEWVIKRTVFLFEAEKINSYVIKEVDKYKQMAKNIECKNGFIYLCNQKEFELRVPSGRNTIREIGHIAIEELAAGMEIILKQNIRVKKDSLFRLLANLIGFKRMGALIYARLNETLLYLKKQEKITVENEVVSIVFNVQ